MAVEFPLKAKVFLCTTCIILFGFTSFCEKSQHFFYKFWCVLQSKGSDQLGKQNLTKKFCTRISVDLDNL